MVGTGHLVGSQLVVTKFNPIEREIVWNFIKECFHREKNIDAKFVFNTIESLVAKHFYIEHLMAEDLWQVCLVN